MKTLISLFLFVALNCSAQFSFTNIFTGTTNNDRTGDNAKLAFSKINTNFHYLTNLVRMTVTGASSTATDGTVTNTFSVIFTNVPAISVNQIGPPFTATNGIQSVTISNFVYVANRVGVSNRWIAIGL